MSANEYISFSTCLGGHKALGNKLFIRECYFEMREAIAKEFNLDTTTLKEKEPIQGSHQMILTGTPGIGKSCFAYFLLVELLRLGEEVVYQIGREYWYFDGGAWSLIADESAAHRFVQTFGHWYICDLYRDEGSYVRSIFAKSIIISSPKVGKLKEILNHGSQRYFLPLWSDEEISLFMDMHGDGIDRSEAEKTIEDWGNVPRNIVLKVAQTLEQTIFQVDSVSSLRRKMDVAANEDLGMPSKLIHLSPNAGYKSFTARICSAKAERLIFERLVENDFDQVVEFAFSDPKSGYQSAAGVAFEHVAHEVLKGGGKYRMQRLGDRNAWEELNLEGSLYVEFPASTRDLEELKITPNGYYKPKPSNFACMDALCLSASGVLYMFQMTRAQKHPIKLQPFLNILKALRAKNKVERVSFVFVVPSGHDEWSSWGQDQVFTCKGGKASKEEESEMRNVTQYIMTLSKEAGMQGRKRRMNVLVP